MSFLVVRLVPESPVDGAAFATFLDGLALQVFDANNPETPLSGLAYSSPLSLFQWQGQGQLLSTVSAPTRDSAATGGSTLTFNSTDGIAVGSYVFSTDHTTILPSDGLQVAEVTRAVPGNPGTPGTVTLRRGNASGTLNKYVPAATIVTFLGPAPGPAAAPPAAFTLNTTAPASTLDGAPVSPTNPLRVLHFDAADALGVTVGMGVTGPFVAADTTVALLRTTLGSATSAVTLSNGLTGSPASVTFALQPPFVALTRRPTSGTPAAAPQNLTFAASQTDGIAVGMTVEPVANLIAAGTVVTAVTGTEVSLSRPFLAALPANTDIRFLFALSNGIFQHVEETTDPASFLGLGHTIVPAAVATAVIPLYDPPPLPKYLAVKLVAVRGAEIIPVATAFHNVLVHTETPPADPFTYQALTPQDTSFYVALPPQPGPDPIGLVIPEDGSPPPFDQLFAAIETALLNDPIPHTTPGTLVATPSYCRRIAYDIVWSSQNTLPNPPDPLESLYTNPPNPGGGGGNDSSTTQNNFEQDRQKFEGELNSFYSTRDANGERLAKFVAAASAAVVCEQASLHSISALVQFPVDAISATFGSAVGSELLVEGLAPPAPGVPSFGVPAAFFYALGAHLDKTTTAEQRFQMATRDALERLLLQLNTAVDAKVIAATEKLSTAAASQPISTFRAARRLVALGVSTASAAAHTTVLPASPLATLLNAWLAMDMPPGPAPNPPPPYPAVDFAAWQQLATTNPTGYLDLDLAALTQGYVLPAGTVRPANDAATGASVLTFSTGAGITRGMPIAGPGIAPGTTAADVVIDTSTPPGETRVTLSTALQAPVSTTTDLTVNTAATATLADQIAAWLPGTTVPATANPTVTTLKLVTAQQWADFFTLVAAPSWLPPFTRPVAESASPDQAPPKPGYLAIRIRAFVRAVQRFFTVSSLPTEAQLPPVDAPPTFDVPAAELIGRAVAALPPGFVFGSPLSVADLDAAVQSLSDLDPATQAWLTETVSSINELVEISSVAPAPKLDGHKLPYPVSLAFSVAEALYARGFRTAADITARSAEDFQQAMTGTVAFDFAAAGPNSLYAKAQSLAPGAPSDPPADGPFAPINPAGSLVDCLPPPSLSPTGPIAYLREMLQLSPDSTIADPFPATAGQTTLGDTVSARRGPLGDLRADRANLLTPLPLIDLVNECLEFLAASQPAPDPAGTVHDTADDRPADRFAAVPQYSTPAPLSGPGLLAYDRLSNDFSSCGLPYSQALDVSRTYLRRLGSSRFEQMRTFRRCITEFVLDPTHEPAGFQPWLWRYPVRTELAVEYLSFTPEEYAVVFDGDRPPACLPPAQQPERLAEEPGKPRNGDVGLADFLAETCLSYCEFLELWRSGFVTFGNAGSKDGKFSDCEPCCPQDVSLHFPGELDLYRLQVFVRLWRKLRERPDGGYSFGQLGQICEVLGLYAAQDRNPDFIRQLAAFHMLREQFGMVLSDPRGPASGRIDLLDLWRGETAPAWPWALAELVAHVERHARRRHGCRPRGPEFRKLLTANLDPLSRLTGFDPASPTDSWHAKPTHTLRFAEILSKIYASRFSVGELIYLFTAGPHLAGDDPFPLQPANEALESPLGLPDDDPGFALWQLRHALLAAEVAEDEEPGWSWERIEAALRTEFGFDPGDVSQLGRHFFPRRCDRHAPASSARFVSDLAVGSTAPSMWNSPSSGPLHFDPAAGQLWARLPLRDGEVIAQIQHVRTLHAAEQQAVQDLFFQPRALLAGFALLFDDAAASIRRLVEQGDEDVRFRDFRRQFLLARRRCRLIAEHLSRHIREATGQPEDGAEESAVLLLRRMAADENLARAGWEQNSGAAPNLTWPKPAGSALAALLGLTGTGLLLELRNTQDEPVWRDATGELNGFGDRRDRSNSPVPTVLPSFEATLSPQQQRFVSVHNGYLTHDRNGERLGGAEGFAATWSGALLIEDGGRYEFGAEPPHRRAGRRWQVVLRRGQRSWVVLSHAWPGEPDHHACTLSLKRGAYDLTVQFEQEPPRFAHEDDVEHQRTGFAMTYRGPDTDSERIALPHHRLFLSHKDESLGDDITTLSPGADAYLATLYRSSLRDIRRTYQRVFKVLLFTHRFSLDAPREPDEVSELSYLLAQPAAFAGAAYYRDGAGFTRHAADFDPDLLPLWDDYRSPAGDARTDPTPQRGAALFDWWERMFDYLVARGEVRERTGRHLWHLFAEAEERHPAHPGYLLRHLGADERHWPLDLRYFQSPDTAPAIYAVTSDDLHDERWTLRAWRAEHWLRSAERAFTIPDITTARPDLWAADHPSAVLPGETDPGNTNLTSLVTAGLFDDPRRTEELARLNDQLRERGRRALIAYLCGANRVALPGTPGTFATTPEDLSGLLLLNVQAGHGGRASRIEEAITAVQSFVPRARLGLEPAWTVTSGFARLWDARFASYRVWQRAKERDLYRENWIEWDELDHARRIEAFRFLESGLRTSTLTLARPGGLAWWPSTTVPAGPEALQRRVPSELRPLRPPPQSVTREGLRMLGAPEYAATPTWLAATPPSEDSPPPDNPPDGPPDNPPVIELAESAAVAVPPLPLWMESAAKLGTRFLRVAAAAAPEAALAFTPRATGNRHEHPVVLDEYYFWLIDGEYYSYGAETDSQSDGAATFQGSYQFGFQDPYYDRFQQQSAEWNDAGQVPALLAKWRPARAVRLAWCRVHNGQFGQARRSEEYVPIASAADLVFLGRAADSLHFYVQERGEIQEPPPGYGADTSPPGFRYDLPSDQALALPLVLKPTPPAPPAAPPGALTSYPFFAYHDPGERLFPSGWFATALAVGDTLRATCHFEAALQWYRRAFDPLAADCTWSRCAPEEEEPTHEEIERQAHLLWVRRGRPSGEAEQEWRDAQAALAAARSERPQPTSPGACCDSTDVSDQTARDRVISLRYCRTLVEWGDAVRRGGSAEAAAQARVLYDTAARILGDRPRAVELPEPDTAPTVSDWIPAYPPLNPRMMDLYDVVAARRHHEETADRHEYFGPASDAAENPCRTHNPYRFISQIARAKELAGRLNELESALLSAYEKADAEYLASVHAQQEREMLVLGTAVRQDHWRDADWQVQALQQTKDVNQVNLLYTAGLYRGGLVNDEIQNLTLTVNAMQTRTGANVVEAIGEAMNIVPDFFVGAMSTFSQIPLGTKLAGLFQVIGKVMQTSADIQSTTAGLDLTQAGWQRRSDEWLHQMQNLQTEIQQVETQILGALRRRDVAQRELNNQQRQIEHAGEIQDFLRDKFTASTLYQWRVSETAALHARMYDLTLDAAREAQRAFNLERGHTTRQFLPAEPWDSLGQGLLAGERLSFALQQMDKAYHDENRRELELAKHLSLRLHLPLAYAQLRLLGHCEIDIPEWLFDVDYPGHYLRRIRSVSLTLPCVVGPYTGVHCRLTLLSSSTRISPETRPPAHRCCDAEHRNEYEPCPEDPRIVREFAARESIATSSGQNDSGLFELNFNDDRYLPSEFRGAASRWRLDLPQENNFFDPDTLTDAILHLHYSARDGGDALRDAATDATRHRLPGDGLRFFEVSQDFPDAWAALHSRSEAPAEHRRLDLSFVSAMFPYVPGRRTRTINQLAIILDAGAAAEGDHHLVRLHHGEAPATSEGVCVRDGDGRGVFIGVIDLTDCPLGPIDDRRPAPCALEIPRALRHADRIFVIARYAAPARERD